MAAPAEVSKRRSNFRIRQFKEKRHYNIAANLTFKKITETRPKKHFKNEQRSKDAAAKKRPNTSGVGKINNYHEDIYIPPYNNTY